jgi:hypothetical protein
VVLHSIISSTRATSYQRPYSLRFCGPRIAGKKLNTGSGGIADPWRSWSNSHRFMFMKFFGRAVVDDNDPDTARPGLAIIVYVPVQNRPDRKARNFATGQDEPTNGIWISQTAFKPLTRWIAQSSSSSVRFNPLPPIASGETRGAGPRDQSSAENHASKRTMCEVAHTSVEISKVLLTPAPAMAGERPCYGRVLCREPTYGVRA